MHSVVQFDERTGLIASSGKSSTIIAAFGNVGGNRKRSSIELVDKEAVASGELFGGGTDLIDEVNRFLVDQELLELEGHSAAPEEVSRVVESRPTREEKVDWSRTSTSLENLPVLNALLLYFLFSTLYFGCKPKSA